MLATEQDRVAVVLVRARNPSNIGAAARAMHDLGFTDLRIVNEYPVPFAAARSAVDASSVLEAAREFTSLAAAVEDCTLILGTTAVGDRALEHPLHVLKDASALVGRTLQIQSRARVALLFGSEKTGLSNEELAHCHALLTIPMNIRGSERHLSMNLGQAVAVCLYDLVRDSLTAPSAATPAEAVTPDHAPAADLERLTSLLGEVFEASGYGRRNPANARPGNVRRLVRRMALSSSDSPVWTGILRQILHALRAAGR